VSNPATSLAPLPAEVKDAPPPPPPGAVAPTDPAAPQDDNVLSLRLWNKFHVRLSAIYGSAVLLVLVGMAVAFYGEGSKMVLQGVQGRLLGTVVALARGIEPKLLDHLNTEADETRYEYARLIRRFTSIARVEPDIVSLYVLKPTDQPGIFKFAADYIPPGRVTAPAAKTGQIYDARGNHVLLRGMKGAVAENEVSAKDQWGATLSAYSPIRNREGQPVALVGVDTEAAVIGRMKMHVLKTSVALLLVAAAILAGVAFVVARSVREPLTRIIGATSAIASGNLETRAGLSRKDEFGILGKHFDDMAAGLQERDRIRSTFGRYVSEDVARRVLNSKEGAKMGGEVREVTVLFSDLRKYSTISETLSPTETVEFLNEYLSVMNETIDKHGGVIIEFLGDAILAVFGAPTELENHPERALRCAIAMREALAGFNAKMNAEGRAPWKKKGMESLGQRIGIHTGQVVAGNLGSKVRVKYAVIGDAVNVASRCEGLNKELGTEILCTSGTRDRVPPDLQAKLTDKGAHPVKGRAQEVAVYAA
jgi:class 3 adenylate cyclase